MLCHSFIVVFAKSEAIINSVRPVHMHVGEYHRTDLYEISYWDVL
jgi:hypothetical protein